MLLYSYLRLSGDARRDTADLALLVTVGVAGRGVAARLSAACLRVGEGTRLLLGVATRLLFALGARGGSESAGGLPFSRWIGRRLVVALPLTGTLLSWWRAAVRLAFSIRIVLVSVLLVDAITRDATCTVGCACEMLSPFPEIGSHSSVCISVLCKHRVRTLNNQYATEGSCSLMQETKSILHMHHSS